MSPAALIATALKGNRKLTTLDLGGNPLGDVGVRALASGLREASGLSVLGLDGAAVGDLGGKELAAALAAAGANYGLVFCWRKMSTLSFRTATRLNSPDGNLIEEVGS